MDFVLILLIQIVGTIGFILGAMVCYASQKLPFLSYAYIYTFSGGTILSLLTLDLIPLAMEVYAKIFLLSGFLIGFGFLFFFHFLSSKLVIFHSNKQVETFLLFCIAISIHNIPLGITLGPQEHLLLPLLIALLFHHIPEGIALFSPMLGRQKIDWRLILVTSFLLTTSLSLGAVLGTWFPSSSTCFFGILMGISIAILSYITIWELLRKGFRELSWGKWLLVTFIGAIVCYLFLHSLPFHTH